MFSVENLYYVLYTSLFKRIKVDVRYFGTFGNTDITDVKINFLSKEQIINGRSCCYFYDQEPVKLKMLDDLAKTFAQTQKNKILTTSEHSQLVKDFCKKNRFYHLYYFFHGFASLDWYHDLKYVSNDVSQFKYKFLSFNRLCTKDRSYRLLLISTLLEKQVLSKGAASLAIIKDSKNIIKKELVDSNCRLSKKAKITVYKNLFNIDKNFIIDKELVDGSSSAHAGAAEYDLWQSAFLHVVSETVFFDEKLHLTEKIFRPIVSRRPFILLGAYKNLEYLKSYGFKTFDKWIDESYDNEPDNEKRLSMVCDEIEKIANLSEDKIKELYHDMQEVLEYNYHHFYNDFKQIIVNELVNNFEGYMRQFNNGKLNDEVYDIDSLDLEKIKKLLAQ